MLNVTIGDAVGGRGESFLVSRGNDVEDLARATRNTNVVGTNSNNNSTDIAIVQGSGFRRFAARIGDDLCLTDSGEC